MSFAGSAAGLLYSPPFPDDPLSSSPNFSACFWRLLRRQSVSHFPMRQHCRFRQFPRYAGSPPNCNSSPQNSFSIARSRSSGRHRLEPGHSEAALAFRFPSAPDVANVPSSISRSVCARRVRRVANQHGGGRESVLEYEWCVGQLDGGELGNDCGGSI